MRHPRTPILAYPFGMGMTERAYSAPDNGYRFGFNGMEMDDEVKGEGNSLDFGARIYDNRLGRWMSLDELGRFYIGVSEYQYALNSCIVNRGIDGREIVLCTSPKQGTVKVLISQVNQSSIFSQVYQKVSSDQIKLTYKGLPVTISTKVTDKNLSQTQKGENGYFMLTSSPMAIKEMNNGQTEIVGYVIHAEISLTNKVMSFSIAPNGYNFATVAEELFHNGQIIFDLENHMTRSSLTKEVEAKVAKLIGYYQAQGSDFSKLGKKDLMNAGFSDYETSLLYNNDGTMKESVKNFIADPIGNYTPEVMKEIKDFSSKVADVYEMKGEVYNGDLQYLFDLEKESK